MSSSPTVLFVCLFQVVSLQANLERLESDLQQQTEQQLVTVKVQANQASELAKVSPTKQILSIKLLEKTLPILYHHHQWQLLVLV